jgi:hypothetical protein
MCEPLLQTNYFVQRCARAWTTTTMLAAAQNILRQRAKRSVSLCGAAAFFGLFLFPAAAQEYLNPVTAPIPGYQAPGMTSGEFIVKQALSFGVAYDSNVLESHSHNLQDVVFFVTPFIDIIHDGGKNIQEVIATVTATRYVTDTADNYQNFYVSGKETYLISPSSAVSAQISFSDGYQRRISRNFDIPINAASPVPETVLLGILSYVKTWTNYEFGTKIIGSQERFSDVLSTSGSLLDQHFRNENDFLTDTYLTTQLTSRLRSILSFQTADIGYQLQTRNYTQWRVADTIIADLTSKTSIGFLAAIKDQDVYNVPGLNLTSLMEYETFVSWNPTQTLSVVVKGGYRDLGIDYVTGIFAGGFAQRGSFEASYYIWRDLRFDTKLDFEKRFLVNNADVQNILTYRASLNYELSSYAGLSFLANSQQWLSRQPFNTFNETTFQTAFNLRF